MHDFPAHIPEFKPSIPITPQPGIKKLTERQHKVQNLINNVSVSNKQLKHNTVRGRALPRPQKYSKPPTKEAASLRNSMHNLMGIYLLPSRFLKEEYTIKQQFLDAHLPLEDAAQLINQDQQHHIMRIAVSEIKASFSDWNTRSLKKKQQISCQLKNLTRLSRLIKDNQLTAKNISIKELEFLTSFLRGDKEFTNRDLVLIKKMLQTPIPSDPKPAQPNDNLRPTLIKAQSHLFEQERKALKSGGKLDRLQNEGISINKVTFISDPTLPDSAPPVAVYKENKGDLQASGIMEELFWELGQLTHSEELLVPTKRTHMRTAEELQPNAGKEKGFDWATESVRSDLGKARRGGLQPFEEGMTLYNWLGITDDKPVISKQSVLEHAHFLRKMGAYDYHSDNIYVTPEGKLKLFDNTRSLPHSNDAIYTLCDLYIPYCFAFYDSPQAQEPLTYEEKAYLKSEIAKDRQDLSIIRAFLEKSSTQAKIAQLPHGWFDRELVLSAMEERIQLMENAINNPNVQSINDFVLFSQPNAKFTFACQALCKASQELYDHAMGNHAPLANRRDSLFPQVSSSLSNNIDQITHLGYDPIEVHKIAEDPNLTFDQMVDKLAALVRLNRNSLEPSQYQSRAAKLKLSILEKACADCKDMSVEGSADNIDYYSDSANAFKDHILMGLKDRFNMLNIFYYSDNGFAEIFNKQSYPCFAMTIDQDQNLRLYYKGTDGTSQVAELDYMQLEDDIDSMQLLSHFTLSDVKQMAPDYFWTLDDANVNDVIAQHENSFLLKVDDDDVAKLMLYVNDGGSIFKMPVIPCPPQPHKPQEYEVHVPQGIARLTMDEIEDVFKNEEQLAPLPNSIFTNAMKDLRILKQAVRTEGCPIWHNSAKAAFDQASAPYYCLLYDSSIPSQVTLHFKGTFGGEKALPVNYDDPHHIKVGTIPLQDYLKTVAPINFYPNIDGATVAKLLKDDPKGWILGCEDTYLYFHYRIGKDCYETYLPRVSTMPDTFEVVCLDNSTQTMTLVDLYDYMGSQGYHPHPKEGR